MRGTIAGANNMEKPGATVGKYNVRVTPSGATRECWRDDEYLRGPVALLANMLDYGVGCCWKAKIVLDCASPG